jgi:hypothetical protein
MAILVDARRMNCRVRASVRWPGVAGVKTGAPGSVLMAMMCLAPLMPQARYSSGVILVGLAGLLAPALRSDHAGHADDAPEQRGELLERREPVGPASSPHLSGFASIWPVVKLETNTVARV